MAHQQTNRNAEHSCNLTNPSKRIKMVLNESVKRIKRVEKDATTLRLINA